MLRKTLRNFLSQQLGLAVSFLDRFVLAGVPEEEVLERFRREARSAQKLAHPNIIEIYDQGDTEDGAP